MKTKKLNLNELKVNSFVTSLEGKDAQTVKGGNPTIILGDVAIPIAMVTAVVAVVVIAAKANAALNQAEAITKGKEESKK